jgi:transglutaminase-like putative cysteine protease
MSDPTVIAPTRVRPRRLTLLNRILPEGPAIFLLLLLVNLCAALATQRADWEHLITPVAAISTLGFVAGWLMARIGVLDSISHIISVVLGAVVSYGFVLNAASQFGGSLTSRTRPVFWHIRDWYTGANNPQQNDDIVLSLLLGVIVWMLAYLSAWVLFRRGWLMMALMLPALLLLVNLGYAPEPEDRFTFAFVALSIPLAARYHLFRKQVDWSRFQMAGPRSLGVRFLTIGAVLAILVTSAGWNAPDSVSQETLQPIIGELGKQIESARQQAQDWMDRSDTGRRSGSGNAYSDFQDSFSIGGEVNLSDQPEVEVLADQPTYLAAQRYNIYEDNGWSSNIDETFDPNGRNGQTYAPAMYFRAGQEVILSDEIADDRRSTSATVVPLKPDSGVMFTIDTYAGASVDSSVRLSWIQLDVVTFDLTDRNWIDRVPPDLMNFVSMLQSTTLSGPQGDYGPMSGDDQRDEQIEQEREELADRFLDVSWQADGDGAVTSLTVSGQVPVYDDVESVSLRSALPNGGYGVEGSVPEADATDLSNDSGEYPDWVIQRYLQLPNTITPRTTELAAQITSEAPTAYDKAKAIESYLRSSITYDTSVGLPPDGQDVVDYLLFDNQRGYCEHYATAMTVMLRTLGIPARVAAGYAPGDFDPAAGSYVYLQSNAHAWVEVYFPDYGWIPFEPTVSEAEISLGDDAAAVEEETEPEDIATAGPTEAPLEETVDSTPEAEDPNPAIAPVEIDDGGGNGGTAAIIIGSVVAVVVLSAGTAWWLWMRRLRGLPASAGLFARLLRIGRIAGVKPKPSTTPNEYAVSLAERLPVTREYAQRIVHAYELDQYAARGSADGAIQAATRAWQKTRAVLIPTMLKRLLPRWRRRR